jgi:hypothetical protein
MDTILQTLHDLEGVNGAVVADGRGQILSYKAHALYDLGLLQQVSHATITAIDSVKLLHEDWESVTAQFAEGKLLIRNIGSPGKTKGADLTLSLIADMRLNAQFAGVAIRVAVGKIRAFIESGGVEAHPAPTSSAKVAVAAPAGGWPSPPALAASTPAIHQTRTSAPEIANSGLSWSGGASSMSSSTIATADAASAAVLASCTKALARSVGPMAKRYVKEAVIRICADRPFSRDQVGALVGELEKYLNDPADASQFRRSALKSA